MNYLVLSESSVFTRVKSLIPCFFAFWSTIMWILQSPLTIQVFKFYQFCVYVCYTKNAHVLHINA